MIDFNGTYYTKEELIFPWTNSILQNGYSVSSYILMRNSRPLFVEEHYLKIIAQMRILKMEIPMTYTPDLFQGVLLKFCKKLDFKEGVLKLSFFELGNSNEIAYSIESFKVPESKTVQMDLYNDYYIQEGSHRFVNTHFDRLYELSSRFAKEQEVDGCFVLNSSKHLADSTMGTLFCLKDQTVFTPSLASGTRDLVSRIKMMQWIKSDQKYQLIEEDTTPFALQKQDAVFLYSFEKGVIPVKQYRKKTYQVELCSYFEELAFKNTLN